MKMDQEWKEKEILYKWGSMYHTDMLTNSIFLPIDQDADSYYIRRENLEAYLREYEFQSLPQLKTELIKMWKNEEYMNTIIKTVLASALKNRIEINMENENNAAGTNKEADELPQYIYNF